jgi:hypothetical protein
MYSQKYETFTLFTSSCGTLFTFALTIKTEKLKAESYATCFDLLIRLQATIL